MIIKITRENCVIIREVIHAQDDKVFLTLDLTKEDITKLKTSTATRMELLKSLGMDHLKIIIPTKILKDSILFDDGSESVAINKFRRLEGTEWIAVRRKSNA